MTIVLPFPRQRQESTRLQEIRQYADNLSAVRKNMLLQALHILPLADRRFLLIIISSDTINDPIMRTLISLNVSCIRSWNFCQKYFLYRPVVSPENQQYFFHISTYSLRGKRSDVRSRPSSISSYNSATETRYAFWMQNVPRKWAAFSYDTSSDDIINCMSGFDLPMKSSRMCLTGKSTDPFPVWASISFRAIVQTLSSDELKEILTSLPDLSTVHLGCSLSETPSEKISLAKSSNN